MGVQCVVCEKKPQYGNRVSHSMRHTRRRWEPNLQTVRADIKGTVKKVTVCTRCLRSNKIKKAA